MIPVQKVVNIYKNAMDLNDRGGSQTSFYQDYHDRKSISYNSKENESDKKSKNSFESILKKTMSK